jgi:hypothetical protein
MITIIASNVSSHITSGYRCTENDSLVVRRFACSNLHYIIFFIRALLTIPVIYLNVSILIQFLTHTIFNMKPYTILLVLLYLQFVGGVDRN